MEVEKRLPVEDLIMPRYKVIADYPYCPYPIGSLVEQTITRFLLTRATCYDSFKMDLAEQDNYVPEDTILKYPHLFKKLEWWEERKESDMPRYVKKGERVYDVSKANEKYPDSFMFDYPMTEHWVSYTDCLPISESEYLTLNK